MNWTHHFSLFSTRRFARLDRRSKFVRRPSYLFDAASSRFDFSEFSHLSTTEKTTPGALQEFVNRMPMAGVEQGMKNWEGEKNFGRKVPEKFLQLPSQYSSLPPLIGGTCLFCPPVEAMHAVNITGLKAIGL